MASDCFIARNLYNESMDFLSGDYWDIIIFGVIAAVLLWQLRGSLGRRKDGEPPTIGNPFNRLPAIKPKVQIANQPEAAFPTAGGTAKDPVPSPVNWAANPANYEIVTSNSVHHRMLPFAAVDPNFRPDDFIASAKKAFAAVVAAFGAGDKKTLEPMLSPGLYQLFAQQIDARDGTTYQAQLHTLRKAMISDATLDGTRATLTVDFVSEQSATQKDAAGEVVSGLDGARQTYKDRWIFARDLKNPDPAWQVLRTEAMG